MPASQQRLRSEEGKKSIQESKAEGERGLEACRYRRKAGESKQSDRREVPIKVSRCPAPKQRDRESNEFQSTTRLTYKLLLHTIGRERRCRLHSARPGKIVRKTIRIRFCSHCDEVVVLHLLGLSATLRTRSYMSSTTGEVFFPGNGCARQDGRSKMRGPESESREVRIGNGRDVITRPGALVLLSTTSSDRSTRPIVRYPAWGKACLHVPQTMSMAG